MRCEHCGSPVDRRELDRGECGSCGAAFSTPRPDPRPVAPAPGPSPVAIVVPVALVALAGVGAGAFALTSGGRSAARGPTATTPAMPSVAEATTPAPSVETPVAAREVDVPPVVTAGTGARRATAASSAPSAPKPSVDRVVAANKSLYDRCQREALAENANAPRRYSVALTIDGDGRAEWVSVVSEASATMRSCVESVTRGLTFPRAASGSERSIVTLSFGAAPR